MAVVFFLAFFFLVVVSSFSCELDGVAGGFELEAVEELGGKISNSSLSLIVFIIFGLGKQLQKYWVQLQNGRPYSIKTIVNLVSKAMWKVLKPLYMPEPTSQKWESIALDFQERWQFPHCVGAIDGKHVVIKKPTKTGSSYFNYKQTFSIVLMVATDSAYRFISIDVGSMGRFSDGNIFASSVLGKKIMKQTLKLPQPSLIPPIDSPIPYVFVADEAFPLLENVMRPFPRRSVTDNYERKVFNYRLSRARQTVECSFGILSSRFRIFQKPFEISVDSVVHVVKAACVLHN
nr:unnamed protein product [Callosobruchus chinensis]